MRERLHDQGCASARRSSSRRRSPKRGLERLLRVDRRRLRPLREPHRHGRVQPPAARHPGRRARRRSCAGRRLKMLLRRAGADAPAALPADGQRPQPRHARLRLLAREPAARGARPAGRARDPGSGRALSRAGARRRRRLVGDGVRGRARARAGTRSSSPAATRRRRARAGDASARTAATCPASASRTACSRSLLDLREPVRRRPSSIALAVPARRLRRDRARRCGSARTRS